MDAACYEEKCDDRKQMILTDAHSAGAQGVAAAAHLRGTPHQRWAPTVTCKLKALR